MVVEAVVVLLTKDKVFPKPKEVEDDVGWVIVEVLVGLPLLLLPRDKVFLKTKEAKELLALVSEDDFGSCKVAATLDIPREEVEPKTWEVVLGCMLTESKNSSFLFKFYRKRKEKQPERIKTQKIILSARNSSNMSH